MPPLQAADAAPPLDAAMDVANRLRTRLRAAVVGRDAVIDLVINALLADGHMLLEDYPGSGKTTLAKALGDCLIDDDPQDDIVSLRRIQFTPDLLPGDVTGTTIFDPTTQEFHFRPGPIFAHVVLADEINRTSPKVQSALLEAMAEKQVTVDNRTRRLDALFFVIATQNPLDLAGTFPLPQAQLDRFLFKVRMTHLTRTAELELLTRLDEVLAGPPEDLPRVTRSEVLAARRAAHQGVYIHPAVKEALVDIAQATRDHEAVLQGVSTRSLVLAMPALQVTAMLHGRDFVSPQDVSHLAPYIFAHRLALAPGSDEAERVVADCARRAMDRLARASVGRR